MYLEYGAVVIVIVW